MAQTDYTWSKEELSKIYGYCPKCGTLVRPKSGMYSWLYFEHCFEFDLYIDNINKAGEDEW